MFLSNNMLHRKLLSVLLLLSSSTHHLPVVICPDTEPLLSPAKFSFSQPCCPRLWLHLPCDFRSARCTSPPQMFLPLSKLFFMAFLKASADEFLAEVNSLPHPKLNHSYNLSVSFSFAVSSSLSQILMSWSTSCHFPASWTHPHPLVSHTHTHLGQSPAFLWISINPHLQSNNPGPMSHVDGSNSHTSGSLIVFPPSHHLNILYCNVVGCY